MTSDWSVGNHKTQTRPALGSWIPPGLNLIKFCSRRHCRLAVSWCRSRCPVRSGPARRRLLSSWSLSLSLSLSWWLWCHPQFLPPTGWQDQQSPQGWLRWPTRQFASLRSSSFGIRRAVGEQTFCFGLKIRSTVAPNFSTTVNLTRQTYT